jgi:hypothetical protein
VLLALVVAVVDVVAGCKAFDGGRVGSATKAQRPKVTAYAWVEVVAAMVTKGQTFVVIGTPASTLKVGKIGAGDTTAVKL